MSKGDTLDLSFEITPRFISRTVEDVNEKRYFGELLMDLNKNSVEFFARNKNNPNTDFWLYKDGKMKKNGECEYIAPPLPTNLASFFSYPHVKVIESLEELKKGIFDQYLHDFLTDEILSNVEIWDIFYEGHSYLLVLKKNGSEFTPYILLSQFFYLHFDAVRSPQEHHNHDSLFEECPSFAFDVERRSSDLKRKISWYVDERMCNYPWLKNTELCENSENSENKYMKADDEKRACIFVHGVGVGNEQSGPPVTEWKWYWGNVDEYVENNCASVLFIREETYNRGWDNRDLQQCVCDVLTANSTTPNVIENTVVFAHSMGNNILGGAFREEVCTLGENSVYYDSNGPAKGSPTASFVVETCQKASSWSAFKKIAGLLGYCQKNDTAFPAYYTLVPDYPPLKGLSDVIDENSSGKMCGTSPFGLSSKYSAALAAVATWAMPKGSVDDGLVVFDSCAASDSNFTDDYHSNYYTAKINHADGTCRDGDGWFGDARQPCSWFGAHF